MIFVTADLHLFHKRILCMDDKDGRLPRTRPFDNVQHMNRTLIDNWNSVVTNEDTIYVLGDFIGASKVKEDALSELTNDLHGHKILLMGNHDRKKILKPIFDEIHESHEVLTVEYRGMTFFMNHYLNGLRWDERHKHECFLHGHTHNRSDYNIIKTNFRVPIYDVGVDGNNYYPISLEEILESYLHPKKLFDLIKCDICGSSMKVHEGPYGKFFGCTRYPSCKGIKNIWPNTF